MVEESEKIYEPKPMRVKKETIETLACIVLATLFLAPFIYVLACEMMGF